MHGGDFGILILFRYLIRGVTWTTSVPTVTSGTSVDLSTTTTDDPKTRKSVISVSAGHNHPTQIDVRIEVDAARKINSPECRIARIPQR